MKKKSMKILALLLCFCSLLSFIPLNLFALNDMDIAKQEATSNAEENAQLSKETRTLYASSRVNLIKDNYDEVFDCSMYDRHTGRGGGQVEGGGARGALLGIKFTGWDKLFESIPSFSHTSKDSDSQARCLCHNGECGSGKHQAVVPVSGTFRIYLKWHGPADSNGYRSFSYEAWPIDIYWTNPGQGDFNRHYEGRKHDQFSQVFGADGVGKVKQPNQDVTIHKSWIDNNNAYGTRPGSVSITLTDKNGATYTQYPSAGSGWSTTFNIPKGNYSYREGSINVGNGDWYEASYNGNTVTNRIKGNTSLTITKTWKDNNNAYGTRPGSITVDVFNDRGQTVKSVTMNSSNAINGSQWQITVSGLEKYDYNGVMYTYGIRERNSTINIGNGDYYTVSQSGNNLTNTLIGNTEISITKTWKDNNNAYNTRPSSIAISIINDRGVVVRRETITSSNAINSSQWKKTFSGLPKYDNQGVKYSYVVKEDNPVINVGNGDRYEGHVSGTGIINQLTGTTELTITKIWHDWNNIYETRPETLQIDIVNNKNQVERTVTLSASNAVQDDSNKWKLKVTQLPKYDEEGALYTYTIREKVTSYIQLNYKEPVYNQSNLTVLNEAFFAPQDAIPEYKITVHKDVINNKNQSANKEDFDKIKLDTNETYEFPIVLKAFDRKIANDYQHPVHEEYGTLTNTTYHGIVTNKGDLIFKNIPAGKYEITELPSQYFNFIDFQKLISSTNAIFEKIGEKYIVTLPGLTGSNEEITVKVTNRIDSFRPYDEEQFYNNIFKY